MTKGVGGNSSPILKVYGLCQGVSRIFSGVASVIAVAAAASYGPIYRQCVYD